MRTHIYKRSDGKWAWRLVANNGQIIATDGGQGYEKKADAFEMARSIVQGDYATADILIQGTDFTNLSDLDGVDIMDEDTQPGE